MSSQESSTPPRAPLSIDFLIVGGGIAGLASGLALTRVGHRVLILERGNGENNTGGGGIRMPPNMSKVLFHWGLESKLKDVALTSKPLLFSKFHSGEILGTQLWSDELLKETRGEFMLTTHHDLYQVLYDSAVSHGAKIRFNTEVREIDAEQGQVALVSGEVLSADVILGADGERGMCRRIVRGRPERITPTGYSLFDATYNTKSVTAGMPEELAQIVNIEGNTVFVAFGNGCAATGYPIHDRRDIAFHFFLRDDGTEGNYGDPPSTDLAKLMPQPCDPRLRVVAEHADNAVRIAITQYEDLEEWVHESNRLLVIGQAAHPIAPGTIQGTAMAIEDGAVLAKLFSHLSSRDQIENFLYAFQDLRHKRCAAATQSEVSLITLFTLEDGPEQEARDSSMQAKFRAGKNVLDADEGEEASGIEGEQWVEIRTIFGYDCEDEADNWWIQWGLLRERSLGKVEEDGDQDVEGNRFSWGSVTVQVNQTFGA